MALSAGESQPSPRDSRYERLIASITDYAIYMTDPDGLVTSWNAGAQRIKGYEAADVLGRHFSRFFTPEDRQRRLPERILESARHEGRHEDEGWRVRKDGSRFWANSVMQPIIDERGKVTGFAKITRDITERMAAQEALRESERQFRLLVENLTDYALFMLDPNGIVTSWNAGAQRIKGYSGNDIIGQHFSRFYTERDRAAGLPARALNTAVQDGRYEAEGWRVRKDGSLFWANVVIDRIRDERGRLVGFAKITRDITERRDAQAVLQEAQAERAYVQKMDALGQLTGGVAHDFNNLLMIVSGHLYRVRKAVGDDDKARQSIEAIDTAVRRGAALTRQLLTFARRQPANPAVVELAPRVDGVRAMLGGSTGAAVALLSRIAPDAWPVKVDANELDLALVNLALNARDAMPAGGTITLTGENVRLEAADTPSHLEGEFVALSVSDTGTGIPPDILDKVFDPFFTTKPGSKGSGLGLSQVWGLAHQSGGTVAIRSEVGRGTTVTLYLPRAQSEAANETAPAAAVEPAAGGRVLLVEDNPEVAKATGALLEQLGYQVERASDAAAGLAAVADRPFDLLVSDIMMPGEIDGLALARAVRRNLPDLPLVLMTGYHQLADQVGREFILLRKPFDLSDLSRATNRALSTPAGDPTSNVVPLPTRPKHT